MGYCKSFCKGDRKPFFPLYFYMGSLTGSKNQKMQVLKKEECKHFIKFIWEPLQEGNEITKELYFIAFLTENNEWKQYKGQMSVWTMAINLGIWFQDT